MKRRAAALVATIVAASARPAAADVPPEDERIEDDAPARPFEAPPEVPLRVHASERLTGFLARGASPAIERFESRTTLVVGARSAPRERDPWRLEVRADLLARAPDDPGKAQAWDFEARPWEAWWRTSPSASTRVTIGFQPLAWGALDVGAAADVFASYDLRLGPALTPGEVRLPLPAVRLVWSPSDRTDLELVALPFFVPHRFDVTGTRYAALAPERFGLLARAFDEGTLARVTAPLARANGIDANPARGEAGARATWRTGVADVALTAAWARSRFPALRTSEALRAAVQTGSAPALFRLQQELEAGIVPLEAVHDGYVQVALDAQGAAGPVPWGVELGISSKRALPAAASFDTAEAPRAHVAQAGMRASHAFGELILSAQLSGATLIGGRGAGAVPNPIVAFGADSELLLAVVGIRYDLEPWLVEATGAGLCGGPRLFGDGCRAAAALGTGRIAYVQETFSVSLLGTALARGGAETLPLASAIDQLALRLDWTPASTPR